MKIGVTAANGQLAQTALLTFQQAGNGIVPVAFARTLDKFQLPGIEVRQGDYDMQASFGDGLSDIDTLLIVSSNAPAEQRIIQHANVLNAATDAGVKKVIFTGIIGGGGSEHFRPIWESMLDMEARMAESGLVWVSARDGLYLEPDLESAMDYQKEGKIVNSAGEGRCGYTTRHELSYAYLKLATQDSHDGRSVNLCMPPISQQELAHAFNDVYGWNLAYEAMDTDAYTQQRIDALGPYMGKIIGGIYEAMYWGDYDVTPDFEDIVGRPHQTITDFLKSHLGV